MDRKEVLNNAYLNACDCLYYGYGQSNWDSYDLTEEEKKEIWKKAKETLEKENRY